MVPFAIVYLWTAIGRQHIMGGKSLMSKKIISVALALMLVIACISGITVCADTTEYTAKLGYSTTGWDVSEWGDNVNTTVTGDGTYTLSWDVGDSAAYDAGVFVIDIAGAQADLDASNKTYNVTDLTITVDGNDVPVDLSKLITGDIEGNGNYRIEIYNLYGAGTADNSPVDPSALVINSNLTITFTIETIEKPTAEGKYELFIAYGGDKESENDWGWSYAGADVEGITAVTATIDEGMTATVSLTFDTPNINSWYFAPCLVGEGIADEIGDIDYTITCKIDGEEVAIDMTAGDAWWTEGTGDYSVTDCIRLAGGYNEWGTAYIAEPAGFTTIEYTVTINSISEPAPAGAGTESTDEYQLFIAYGGDKEAENDWAWGYSEYDAVVEGITAVCATVKSGDTATISLTFDTPTVNSWWFAPCLVSEDISLVSAIDYTVTCKIDGEEVAIDLSAGDAWWTEGTGSYTAEQCIRLAGGYNEWGTQYIAEPAGFTTIEYTITINSIKISEPVEEPVVEIDKDGTYNAYLMLQTPGWTFRNAWDDASYGIEGTSWESISNTWGQYLVHTDADKAGMTWGNITDTVIAGNGTYSVKITDFGTIFSDDFTNNGQDYFNIIAISTDIPYGADVEITNVKLYVDGELRHTYEEGYINSESGDYIQILVQNIWNSDVKEISYYPAPTESLEIEFTISGFNYNKASDETVDPGDSDDTDTPTATAPAVADDTTTPADSNTGLIVAIAVVAAVAIAVVVVLVLKKKKN